MRIPKFDSLPEPQASLSSLSSSSSSPPPSPSPSSSPSPYNHRHHRRHHHHVTIIIITTTITTTITIIITIGNQWLLKGRCSVPHHPFDSGSAANYAGCRGRGPVFGYLRVPTELADNAVVHSGRRALFVSIVARGAPAERG